LLKPPLQLQAAGLLLHPSHHFHPMVGRGRKAQVKAAAQGTPLRVPGAVNHPAHAGLHQGPSAHGAGLQGHQQGVLVEAPVLAKAGCLGQGLQFPMAQGILAGLAAVAAPSDRQALGIKHHRRHRHLPPITRLGRQPHQPFHPEVVGVIHQW